MHNAKLVTSIKALELTTFTAIGLQNFGRLFLNKFFKKWTNLKIKMLIWFICEWLAQGKFLYISNEKKQQIRFPSILLPI